MEPDAMILVFLMLSFKPTFSLSSFTFIKRLFSSSSLSVKRVVSSPYLKLLIFLPAILIPAIVYIYVYMLLNLFANILLRISASIFMRDIGLWLSIFCNVFLSFWHQGVTNFTEWIGKFSSSSVFWKILCKIGDNSFYFFIYYYFPFIFISWRLITLQYCSGFCHTLTWIRHGFTCIPHPDPPSHLPLYPIPLGLPSAPGPSTCLMHPTWAGDLFHPW